MSPEDGDESVEDDCEWSRGEVSMRSLRVVAEEEEDDEDTEARAAEERATTCGMPPD